MHVSYQMHHMHNLAGAALLLIACLGLLVWRRRLGMFWCSVAFLAVSFAYLRFGVAPPVPASLVKLYGLTAVIAVILYATSSEAGREAVWRPIRAVMVDPARRSVLYALLVGVPALAAWQSYSASLPTREPPPLVRSVHPSPPSTISITPPLPEGPHAAAGSASTAKAAGTQASAAQEPAAPQPTAQAPKTIDLVAGDNPLRRLLPSNPSKFAEQVAQGKTIYYQNCFYCHGDDLRADGHYASAIQKPPPATFQDPGVLPLFQETFFFWRIAKGGPGLPDEGTPWDSVMPVWEKFLGEEEMWQVVLFLYDFTGYTPRAVGQAATGSPAASAASPGAK